MVRTNGQSVAAGADYLTVREVAGRLRVSTATVYKLVENGSLHHVRVASSIRVSGAALSAYLKGSCL